MGEAPQWAQLSRGKNPYEDTRQARKTGELKAAKIKKRHMLKLKFFYSQANL
jgi:hypothetical protein